MTRFLCGLLLMWYLLMANTTFAFSAADTARGANGAGRYWWDVLHYDLHIDIDTTEKVLSGVNVITFQVGTTPTDSFQIDMQAPMLITSVRLMEYNGSQILPALSSAQMSWTATASWIKYPFTKLKPGGIYKMEVTFRGSPRVAVNPPWDGGFSWASDSSGHPWISVSCQNLGSSVWWPCKDVQWDEPDSGMDMHFKITGKRNATASYNFAVVSNGRLVHNANDSPGEYHWHVKNPINNYDVAFYAGDYEHWQDTLLGEKGNLDLDFWVLRANLDRAKKQFKVVKQMIHCFEYWLGPYPFYEDGYKLVEAPFLGMEHQSAVAYGNKFQMGYEGFDRTGTGVGMNFDYIIIHESGHEWFGNNITARDAADNWIHEGITTYTESLFEECLTDRDNALKYTIGEWHDISNRRPLIADYGVNREGPGDIYDKGAAIIHMIRTMTGNDERFRKMLRGLGQHFYHQTVTTAQVEAYIAEATGLDLGSFFDQYLRRADVPQLEYYIKDKQLNYRFQKVEEGFVLPIKVNSGSIHMALSISSVWQHIPWKGGYNIQFGNDMLYNIAAEGK